MEFPMPQSVNPISAVEYANQYADLNHRKQQGRLIDMQIEQAPQELAYKQQKMQQELQSGQAASQESDLKLTAQKHAYAKKIGAWIYGQASQSGLQEGTPEFQQYLEKLGAPVRPLMAKMFDDPQMLTKPMDWNALKSLAQGPDLGTTAGGYHPPVATNQGTLQYGDNGWEPIKIGKNVAMPVGADVGLQGSIAGAKSANEYVVTDGRAYKKGDISAGGMPSAPQQPQAQPQQSSDQWGKNGMPQEPTGVPDINAELQDAISKGDIQRAQSLIAATQGKPSTPYDGGFAPAPQRNMPMTPEQKAQLETETKANQERDKADIALQTEKAKAEQEQNNPVRVKARSDVSKLLNDLETNYAYLDKADSIHNDTKGTLSNLQAEINTSAPGLYASQAIGTKAKSVRNDIEAVRRTLMPAIMKATGMTGSQLNSDVELQNFMKQLTDPNTDIATVKSQINRLREMYGDQSSAGGEGGLTEAEKKELGELKARYKR